jgi:hypothetical protein
MKIKMKMSVLSVAAVSLAALAMSAQASVLIGFHQYPNLISGSVGPNPVDPGLATSTFTSSSGFGSVGGSTDGFYGPDSGPNAEPTPTMNAEGRIFFGSTMVLSLKNTAPDFYNLSSLLFDATGFGTNAMQVSWASTSPQSPNSGSSGPLTGTAGLSFNDYSVALGSMLLAPGETINFTWVRLSGVVGGELDNVAITGIAGIPEPSSLLALGTLVGSGLMLRSRRRRTV